MTTKTALIAIMVALGGCGALEPGSSPDNAIEVTEQKLALNNPFGGWVPVRVIFGKFIGQHWVVFKRTDTGQCLWYNGLGGATMTTDVFIGLSDGDDIAYMAGPAANSIECEGTTYYFQSPVFQGTQNGQPRTWFAGFAAGAGNDIIHCRGMGWCYGGDGNDLVIASQAEAGPPYLQLYGDAGRDRLIVDGNWPVSLYGGTGQDCLSATHPNTVTAYNCANANSTSDPEWDASVGWIGPWCNQLSAVNCPTW